MTDLFTNLNSYAGVTIKREKMEEDAPIQPDDAPFTPSVYYQHTSTHDPDDDVDDKAHVSRTTVSSRVHAHESTVQHISLSAVQPATVVNARDALPHQNTVYSLDAYDEPRHAATSRGVADSTLSRSSQSAASLVSYLIARHKAGGPAISDVNSRGYDTSVNSVLLRNYLSAPPSRCMPASNSSVAEYRLALETVSYAQFVELCSTARAGEVRCVRNNDCEALNIRNKKGERINDTPFVAHWFTHELAEKDGPDSETFRRDKWEKRACIWCEVMTGARFFVTSASTNTGMNAPNDPHQKAKAAIGWCVMINRDGEFIAKQTIGPDETCFNGLVGNIPRPSIIGWSLRSSPNAMRLEFKPPHGRYPSSADASTVDARRGF